MTTLKSVNLELTQAKIEIVTHKNSEAIKIQEIQNHLNPLQDIMTQAETLWKTVFPKKYIFYTEAEDLPDCLDLNQKQYKALQQLQKGIHIHIKFLREQLEPVILRNDKVANEMKLKYACLRENTTYYGQKTESKIEQSYSMAGKYLNEYSLYAMQKCVDDYVAPKLKGKWNPNTQEHEVPEYPFPALGELRAKLNQYHRLGTAFLHNCEFILLLKL